MGSSLATGQKAYLDYIEISSTHGWVHHMLNFSIIQSQGILVLRPNAPLSKEDFDQLGTEVDAYLSQHAKLHGVMIHAESFPGWEDFGAFMAHMHFVREHHKQIERIAVVTDTHLVSMIEMLAKLFTSAEIRKFPFEDDAEALKWLESADTQNHQA